MKTLLINTDHYLILESNSKVLEKIQEITKIQDKKIIKEIYDFFNEILSNMKEYTSGEYPKSTFFKYNNKIYFDLDLKNDIMWCRYTDFWSKFETNFGLKYKEIRKLTQYMLGIHLKKVPTTMEEATLDEYELGIHLKRKVAHLNLTEGGRP